MIGTVKWFNKTKGFGFIVSDKKDYFIHFSDINPGLDNFKELSDGDKVSFEPASSPKGMVAKKVSVCDPENPQYITA